MADSERENIVGFVDKRRTGSAGQTGNINTAETTSSYGNVMQLRARLAAINAAYYTTARLNNMTKNDMVYAVRLADDAAGV